MGDTGKIARLQVGSAAPNLVLANVQNTTSSLADLWANGPTVLTFLRHFG